MKNHSIELHMMTNCIPSAPRTIFLEATYKSFRAVFGDLPVTVWCDPHPNTQHFEAYRENLINAGFSVVNKTKSLADGYLKIIESSRSDYIFVLEHDWAFVAENIKHTLPEILNLMYRERLYYFRFNRVSNHVCGWDAWLKERTRDDFKYCLSPCWSGNPHILDRKLCIEKGVIEKLKAKSTKTTEKKLNDDGDLMGALYGGLDHPPTIVHLDGRGDFPKPHWSKGQIRRIKKKKKKEARKSIAICIPWREGKDKWRKHSKNFTFDYYSTVAGVFLADVPGKFSISACRNQAAREALDQLNKLNVLFFADSDTFVSEEQIRLACGLAVSENRMVIAYDRYYRLDKKATKHFYHKGQIVETGRLIENHVSGAVAVPVSLFKEVGGFDERFNGWGGDDRAFYCACNTITGHYEALRVTGTAYHLYHRPSPYKDKKSPEYAFNVFLGIRYKEAAGIPEKIGILPETENDQPDINAMIALLSEPMGPKYATDRP